MDMYVKYILYVQDMCLHPPVGPRVWQPRLEWLHDLVRPRMV